MSPRARVVLLALLASAACRKAAREPVAAAAQLAGGSADVLATDSVAQAGAAFTQGFYDWYAHHQDRLETAVADRPEVFEPALLAALRADLAASARSPGEVTGLDWDPFLGGQDRCDPYRVDIVTRRADTLFVAVRGWCSSAGSRSEPDAIPELLQRRGRWMFVDVRHGADEGTLRQDLARLAAARDSTAPRR